MSLTREALDKWLDYAKRDLEGAPADGMLVYLIEKHAPDTSITFSRRDVETIAVAYYKAMVQYTKM